MRFEWDWDYTWEILPLLGQASLITAQVTFLGFFVALVTGLLMASLRMSKLRAVSLISAAVIEFIRSTPLLIQIFFLFYVLPDFGIYLSPLAAGVLALGLHYGAYCAEVYRAGLSNVPKGQWEASIALNLSPFTTFKNIIIPQAIPPVVPALGNYLIALFKETPLLSAITVVELMLTAKNLGSQYFKYSEPITLVGLFFLFFSLISAALVRQIEWYLKTRKGTLL